MPFNTRHCRILIVDPSIEMLALMSNLLRPFGFDLVATSTADEALRQAATFLPDAVYMGLEYNDFNGWELAKQIREVEGMEKAMFVGLRDREEGAKDFDSTDSHGFDYYLPKPPRMADIVAALTKELPSTFLPSRPNVSEFRQD